MQGNVKHPKHYNVHPSGVECIQVVQYFNFNRGNAIKYIWRAGEKDPAREIEDLQKAREYLDFEIERLTMLADRRQEEAFQDAMDRKAEADPPPPLTPTGDWEQMAGRVVRPADPPPPWAHPDVQANPPHSVMGPKYDKAEGFPEPR